MTKKFQPSLNRLDTGIWKLEFSAMASPCEILFNHPNFSADNLSVACEIVLTEASRIESKFSRYQAGNIIHDINHGNGRAILLDDETQGLIDFAHTCFHLSSGLFDITAGVSRKIWRFDGGNTVPSDAEVAATLADIGWQKCLWQKPYLTIPPGAQIDLGGIGKEYAADRCLLLLTQWAAAIAIQSPAMLVNLGGDISCCGPQINCTPWHIGLQAGKNIQTINMVSGGVATSGDTFRYINYQGKRLSHIINPTTCRPVDNAPHTVTVIANNCTQAGMLATFAMLQGENAENFLEGEHCEYFICRGEC